MITREQINILLTKIYLKLAEDLAQHANDEQSSKLYQLHDKLINPYFTTSEDRTTTHEARESGARAILDAFASLLGPDEQGALLAYFQTAETALVFAEGMKSIFRLPLHKPVRPYNAPSMNAEDGPQALGW